MKKELSKSELSDPKLNSPFFFFVVFLIINFKYLLKVLFKSVFFYYLVRCLYFLCRYAFTILANIGVYVAMLLLLEFVSTGGRNGSPDRDTAKLTSFNVWAYHNPAPSQNGLLGDDDSRTSDIRSGDVWIFSVCLSL